MGNKWLLKDITATECWCIDLVSHVQHQLWFHAVPFAEQIAADTEMDAETQHSEIPCHPSADHSPSVWQHLCSDFPILPTDKVVRYCQQYANILVTWSHITLTSNKLISHTTTCFVKRPWRIMMLLIMAPTISISHLTYHKSSKTLYTGHNSNS